MAREHPAGNHPLHPGSLLSYALAAISRGPWPERLALGPLPRVERDFVEIAAWGADLVLSLVQDGEADRAGVADLGRRLAENGADCVRAPIRDFDAPDTAFELDWAVHRERARAILDDGGRVLVHCWGGRGRSGTITAALLIAGGIEPGDAISLVREARPGAIETPQQEAWLHRQERPPAPV